MAWSYAAEPMPDLPQVSQQEEPGSKDENLIDEAQTMPLFGGRRAVWVKAGSRNIVAAVQALLKLPQIECRRRTQSRR